MGAWGSGGPPSDGGDGWMRMRLRTLAVGLGGCLGTPSARPGDRGPGGWRRLSGTSGPGPGAGSPGDVCREPVAMSSRGLGAGGGTPKDVKKSRK